MSCVDLRLSCTFPRALVPRSHHGDALLSATHPLSHTARVCAAQSHADKSHAETHTYSTIILHHIGLADKLPAGTSVDVFLDDGRFRLACALEALAYVSGSDSTLLLHDYSSDISRSVYRRLVVGRLPFYRCGVSKHAGQSVGSAWAVRGQCVGTAWAERGQCVGMSAVCAVCAVCAVSAVWWCCVLSAVCAMLYSVHMPCEGLQYQKVCGRGVSAVQDEATQRDSGSAITFLPGPQSFP